MFHDPNRPVYENSERGRMCRRSRRHTSDEDCARSSSRRDVAQLGSAPGLGLGGRRFKSYRLDVLNITCHRRDDERQVKLKLHQVLALQKGAMGDAHTALTRAHHDLMKTQLLTGRRKTYRPANDEDTTVFPSEYQKVQLLGTHVISSMLETQVRAFDLTAARDYTNTRARASVIVDGNVLVQDAPTPYLLWLDKQIENLETFVKKLPVLNPEFNWNPDPAEGWATDPVETTKTKKVKKVLVLHPGTDKHPPQVAAIDEDVVQGYWTSIQYSGALPQADVNAVLRRLRVLHDAVKVAIAEANAVEADTPKHGRSVFDFLFAGIVE